MLRIKGLTRKEIAKLPPPIEDTEIDDLLIEQNGEHWTPARFRIDFTRPWTQFEPNASARRVFIGHFLHNSNNYTIHADLRNELDIGKAIDRHLPHARKMYKEHTAALDPKLARANARHHSQNSRKATVSAQLHRILLILIVSASFLGVAERRADPGLLCNPIGASSENSSLRT